MTVISKRVLCTALAVVALLCNGCFHKDVDQENATNSKTVAEYLKTGADALDNSEWSRARDAFDDAIKLRADVLDAYYGRAVATCVMAEDHYRLAEAAATNQDEEKGLQEAAKADEFFAQALEDLDKCVELDDAFADAYYLKGVIAQYQGRWEDGIEAFTQCIKHNPSNGEAYHRRGEIYDHTMDSVNAAIDFKKARELGFAAQSAEDNEDIDLEDFSDLNYDAEEDSADRQ
ncbi:MAG: tetratricopeptide repeat protein [Planctomycetia bacterium]|nr:tetratricopeptide repeat protein [Planctomycetia bacterium]